MFSEFRQVKDHSPSSAWTPRHPLPIASTSVEFRQRPLLSRAVPPGSYNTLRASFRSSPLRDEGGRFSVGDKSLSPLVPEEYGSLEDPGALRVERDCAGDQQSISSFLLPISVTAEDIFNDGCFSPRQHEGKENL